MTEKELPIAHIHLEKTGGTSIKDLFIRMYGAEKVLAYNPITDVFESSKNLKSLKMPHLFRLAEFLKQTHFRKLINQMTLLLHSYKSNTDIEWDNLANYPYAVISGHYPVTKINSLPKHTTVTVVRDPLERMYSQWLHWKRLDGTTRFRNMLPGVNPENTNFESFAFLGALQNFQTQALMGIPLEKINFVGVTEYLDPFARLLVLKLGFDSNIYPLIRKNETSAKPPMKVTEEFVEKFELFHAKDYELYRMALLRNLAETMN